MVTKNCPAPEKLKGFAVGDLPDEQIESVADHLESCTQCEDTVALLESQPDTFIGRLRTPNLTSQFADEQELEGAVAAAGALVNEPRHDGETGRGDVAQPQVDQLREYRLLGKLGEGGMGTVYKALHTRLRRVVALKMLPAERVAHGPSVARFAREIEAVGKLDHPNIVRAFDAGEDDEMHYLVMEFVDGIDLHQLVKQIGPLPVTDACEIVRQAALGLQHAHEHDLVHRDVKPSNLLLSRDGTVKVLDLGLALLQGEPRRREELTTTGQVMGTLDYIAPEQASDSHQVDVRADVYSLGCTLFKLLTGRAPFASDQHDSALKKLLAHTRTPPPALKDHRSDVPHELGELLQRMLAKDPDHRPANPAEVAAALEPLVAGADLSALASQMEDLSEHEAPAASADEIPVMLGNAGNGSSSDFHDDRGPQAWLWLGWALIATAFVCLGLTIASMTTAFEVTGEAGGTASGLAHGMSYSLRYMALGAPAFVAGLIVLIVTYVRKLAAQSNHNRRGSWASIAGIALTLFIAAMAFGQVVIRVNQEDGRSTQIATPHGSEIAIDSTGNVEVTLPDTETSLDQRDMAAELRKQSETPSPDGSMVVYTSIDEDGDAEIFVARRDGSEARQLTNNDSNDLQADWSPDGKQIAFASTREGTWQVYVMDRDGSNVKNMSESSINALGPKFGPDGRIAFVSYERDMGRFHEVDLKITADGQPEKIVASGAAIVEFAWHPNGGLLVYATSETPDSPGQFVFYCPEDDTSKVVRYTDIDERLQMHAAHEIRWHVQPISIRVGDQDFPVTGNTDWISCRIPPRSLGPLGAGPGFGDSEIFIISLDGEAHCVSLDPAVMANDETTTAGRSQGAGDALHEPHTKVDSTKLAMSRLDGSWRLARSNNTQGKDGAGTRADVIIDINPQVINMLPMEFKHKLDERGVSIVIAGYMTYKREEQLFAIADWNDQLMLVAFGTKPPHEPIGDALVKLDTAPKKQDDQLFINEGYEDDEPFEIYNRLGSAQK